MEIIHKDYRIDAFETEPGRWRARIQRTDRHKIKDATGGEHGQITTGGQEAFSAEEAIGVARGLIDRGRLIKGSMQDQ
jgi:hypothetical protein